MRGGPLRPTPVDLRHELVGFSHLGVITRGPGVFLLSLFTTREARRRLQPLRQVGLEGEGGGVRDEKRGREKAGVRAKERARERPVCFHVIAAVCWPPPCNP